MSIRKSLAIAPIAAALFATGAFAASVAAPETPGSAGPQAVSESIHLARQHGLQAMQQPEAQAPALASSEARAEAIHLARQHGVVNDSADQRMLREGARY